MAQQMNPGLSHPDLGRPNTPQAHVHTDFGAHHRHKPTKAIIGVAILVVMSFLTYEFRSKVDHPHTSAADQSAAHQVMASSNH